MTYLALDDIEQAHARIHPHLTPTPLIALDLPETGRRISVKPEHLQPTGSFKIRGASNCVARLTDEQKQRGVIAYSTGNHAQAVAMAARAAGIPATIVMSPDVPQHKLERTRALGARLMMAEPTSEARRKLAEQYAGYEGLTLIPPYDDLTVMAGQGTIGLEILDEVIPSTVYVPIGGGGLIAGIAAAIKQKEPFVRVVGVEPVDENAAFRSWAVGQRVGLPGPSASIADAIKVQIPGEKTFPLMQRYVDDIVLVDEARIVDAMRLYFQMTGYRLEPAGAAALAAAMDANNTAIADPVICIGTGQNVTSERFSELVGL